MTKKTLKKSSRIKIKNQPLLISKNLFLRPIFKQTNHINYDRI
jgi:hypothetical protein